MTMESIASIYKGRGLYQIHLVKADAIRPFIPKQLKLVQTFGYSLGGFYLGNYEDSCFGAFEELVVTAGIVKAAAAGPSPPSAVRVVAATKVSDELTSENEILTSRIQETNSAAYKRDCMTKIVLQSKPFVAFEFNSMKMMVDSPTLVYQR